MTLHSPDDIKVSKQNITRYLARTILSGQLKHNETIPNEVKFAENYGVSRTMVRDILKTLEMKGLIERKSYAGTRVRSINSWNLLDPELLEWSNGIFTSSRFLLSLLEIRLIIEPQAAALAAIRADDSNLLQIRSNFSELLEGRTEDGKLILNVHADIRFHKSILKACGNLLISQFGSAIEGALHHTIYQSNKIHMDHEAGYKGHEKVLNAIESRNPEMAYAGMCSVLNSAISNLNLQVSGVILSDFDCQP